MDCYMIVTAYPQSFLLDILQTKLRLINACNILHKSCCW